MAVGPKDFDAACDKAYDVAVVLTVAQIDTDLSHRMQEMEAGKFDNQIPYGDEVRVNFTFPWTREDGNLDTEFARRLKKRYEDVGWARVDVVQVESKSVKACIYLHRKHPYAVTKS